MKIVWYYLLFANITIAHALGPGQPAPPSFVDTPAGNLEKYLNDHPNEGCPSNSSCSQQMGKKRAQWIESLENMSSIDESTKVMASAWMVPSEHRPLDLHGEISPQLITWTSQCRQHQSSDEENPLPLIRLAETYTSNVNSFSELNTADYAVVMNRGYLVSTNEEEGEQKSFTRYNLPTDEVPILFDNGKLVYLLQDDGHYYSLSVDANGKLELLSPTSPPHFPRTVKCPDEAIAHFISELEIQNLYVDIYCREVWDNQAQDFRLMAFGWTCA